jgi:mono/diheme cytochrome c family protein
MRLSILRRAALFVGMLAILSTGISLLSVPAAGQARDSAAKSPNPPAEQGSAAKQRTADEERLEGEKRFHNNCGRCHMAPQKFPPRVMAMVIRHMRVRATITDEDMRLILNYMTQ